MTDPSRRDVEPLGNGLLPVQLLHDLEAGGTLFPQQV